MPRTTAPPDRLARLLPWLVPGLLGWAGVLWIGWSLWQSTPPHAGFDLALLLDAARRVLAGQGPYDPAMLAGASPDATSLFYSYPPPVAQAMTLVARLPDGVVLVLWGVGATAGLAYAARRLAIAHGRADPGADAIRAAAIAPLVLPFAIAVLFGNLDAWYPLAFGLLVLAVLPGASGRAVAAGGIAMGIASVAKLHPASLLLWLGVRAVVERGGPSARALGAAAAVGLALVALSVAAWGTGPWADYVAVLRAGAGSALADPRNAGPVSMLGQVVPLDAAAARAAQAVVALAALAVTVLAAIRVRDPLASVAIAIAASLVVLPVTWYHYPVALIPVGIAVAMRRPAMRARVAAAVVIVDAALWFIPLLWAGVGVLLAALPGTTRDDPPVPVTGRTTPL